MLRLFQSAPQRASGESEKKLAQHIGSVVGQMFRLAEVLDPLPPSVSETKQ